MATQTNLKEIQEYLKSKIAEEQLEWIGDFREEDGEYFFNIKLPFLRKVDFTNSIFIVVDVDACSSQGCHIKLKVESNFLNFLVTNS